MQDPECLWFDWFFAWKVGYQMPAVCLDAVKVVRFLLPDRCNVVIGIYQVGFVEFEL